MADMGTKEAAEKWGCRRLVFNDGAVKEKYPMLLKIRVVHLGIFQKMLFRR